MPYLSVLCHRLASCSIMILLVAAAAGRAEADVILRGRITDEQGNPMPGAELFVRSVNTYDGCAGSYWKSDRDVVVYSDEDGRFTAQGKVGMQRLSVFAEGYAPMHRTHRGYTGENPGWDFTLVKSARVSCQIQDTNGQPQHPRYLYVTPADYPKPPPAPDLNYYWYSMSGKEISKPDGSFDILNLSPGRYSILVMSPIRLSKMSGNGLTQFPVSGGQFEVTAGQVITNFEVRVRPPEDFAVAGRIRQADGAPMANVTVTTLRSGGARTDSNGFFRIQGLDALASNRFPLQFNHKISLSDVAMNTTNLDIIWPGTGMIEGHVFDAATGSNLVGYAASVPTIHLDDTTVYEKPAAEFKVLPEGRFRLKNIPKGSATLIVSNDVLGSRQFTVDVQEGETAEVECPMPGPAILEGHITLNGKPHHCSVVVNGQWIYSGMDGRYRFENQPDGEQVVWFFDHEYSHRYADVELIAGQTVRLDMNLGGACVVKGVVRFPGGSTDRCELRLAEISPAGAWDGGRPWPPERVLAIVPVKASNATFALNNLPAGHFFLTAGVPMGFQYQPAWTREIDLKDGEPLVLDIDLSTPSADSKP